MVADSLIARIFREESSNIAQILSSLITSSHQLMCPADMLWARSYRPLPLFSFWDFSSRKAPVHQIFMNPVIRNVYSVFLPDKDFQHLGAISVLLVSLIYRYGFFDCDRFFRSSDRLPDYRNYSGIPILFPELISLRLQVMWWLFAISPDDSCASCFWVINSIFFLVNFIIEFGWNSTFDIGNNFGYFAILRR